MSLAIRVGDSDDREVLSGLFYINATERFEITYGNRLTKHPLDSGANVSDHVIMDNPVYTIQGVISGVDIGLSNNFIELDGLQPTNTMNSAYMTSINSTGGASKYIPDIISQFLDSGGYSVEFLGGGSEPEALQESVKELVVNTMTKVTFNNDSGRFFNSVVPVILYELDLIGNIRKSHDNLVITSFVVKEDKDTGEALFFNMSLEQFRDTNIKSVDVEITSPEVSKAVAKEESKGTATTEEIRDAPESVTEDLDQLEFTGEPRGVEFD